LFLELLNLELLNRRKALNEAKRLNGWYEWNWLSVFVRAAFSLRKNPL